MAIGDHIHKDVPSPELSEHYKTSFRVHVFSLLKMGYDCINHKVHNSSEETVITEELVKAIRKILEDPSPPDWKTHYTLHEDPPLNIPGQHGKQRPRVDIQFELVRRGPRPRYEFEAKRLSANRRGVTQYLGNDGLGCFLDGRYARNASEAGMLGYVQSHTQEYWQDKIKQRFDDNDENLNVCYGGGWISVRIVPNCDHCYCSRHNRPQLGRPITIYHSLLLFC